MRFPSLGGAETASGLPQAPGRSCEPWEKMTSRASRLSFFQSLRRQPKRAAMLLRPGTGLHGDGNRRLQLAAGDKVLI